MDGSATPCICLPASQRCSVSMARIFANILSGSHFRPSFASPVQPYS